MDGRKVAGCVFGLKSVIEGTRGKALCKAWKVWTNNPSLALALDGPHVRCPGGCDSVAVNGRNTAHTGSYPDQLVVFVNRALSSTESEVWSWLEHSLSRHRTLW